MLTSFCALLALAFGLLFGSAGAGEEIMPMRAPADAGRTSVVMPDAPSEASAAMRGRVDAAGTASVRQPAEVRFTEKDDYVVWKSALLRKPIMVAGGALEMEVHSGYAAAQPYAQLPVRSEGVLAYLVRDLTLR